MGWRGRLRSLAWNAFLISLLASPIIYLPLQDAIRTGVSFALFRNKHITKTTEAFSDDISEAARWSGISVPGAMSFEDWQDSTNAFQVRPLKLKNWLSELNFILPEQYSKIFLFEDDESAQVPIDKAVDLETLMRDVSSCGQATMNETWVFVSGLAWPEIFPWDAAFVKVIEHSYTWPLRAEVGFAYVECTRSRFLCGVWAVYTPALIHFKVEDAPVDPEEIGQGLTYDAKLENLRQVSVRIIEFPLEDAYTGTGLDTFPSPFAQLSAIILHGLYEQFETYEPLAQLLRKFWEEDDRVRERKGTVVYYLSEADDWMTRHVLEPLNLEDAVKVLQSTGWLLAFLATEMVVIPINLVMGLVQAWLAIPTYGDRVLAPLINQLEENERQADDPWAFLGDIFSGLANGGAGPTMFPSAFPPSDTVTSA